MEDKAIEAAWEYLCTKPERSRISYGALVDILEKYEAAKGDGWQPIGSAPRDGQRLLFALEDGNITCGAFIYQEDGSAWWTDDNYEWIEPTHWRPLPQPPRSEASDETNV